LKLAKEEASLENTRKLDMESLQREKEVISRKRTWCGCRDRRKTFTLISG
jgi:hypothetical protein